MNTREGTTETGTGTETLETDTIVTRTPKLTTTVTIVTMNVTEAVTVTVTVTVTTIVDVPWVIMIDLVAGKESETTETTTTKATAIVTGTRKDPVGLRHLTRGTDMTDATVTITVARTDQVPIHVVMNLGEHLLESHSCILSNLAYPSMIASLQLRPICERSRSSSKESQSRVSTQFNFEHGAHICSSAYLARDRLSEEQREMRSVFVSQLSARVGDRELAIFFEQNAGKVREARVIMDRISRRSKG